MTPLPLRGMLHAMATYERTLTQDFDSVLRTVETVEALAMTPA